LILSYSTQTTPPHDDSASFILLLGPGFGITLLFSLL